MPWNDNIEGATLEIASSNASPMKLLAGPGTGKTFTLMRRIARLLEDGDGQQVNPANILLVTFTRTAAHDLKNSLEALNINGIDRIRAGTLHSFCYSILNRTGVLGITGITPRALLMYEERFLEEDLKHAGLGCIRDIQKKKRAFEAGWARLLNEQPGWPTNQEDIDFQSVMRHWLRDHHAMLISELVPETRNYLANNPNCSERNFYSYVFVDEYQDLNRAEQRLIDYLAKNSRIFMVIGDDDQSIYEEFRYAHHEGIIDFNSNNPGNNRELNECRRCPIRLVNTANNLIGNNQLRSEENRQLSPRPSNPEGDIIVVQWEDMNAESEGISNYINTQLENNVFNPGEILVLCPRRETGYAIKRKLNNLGKEAHSFFSEKELEGNPKKSENNQAQKAYTLMNLIVNPNDLVSIRCWLGFDHNSLNAKAYKRIQDYSHSNSQNIVTTLDGLKDGTVNIPYTTNIVEKYSSLRNELLSLQGVVGNDLVNRLFPVDQDWAYGCRSSFVDVDEDSSPTEILDTLKNNIIQPEMPVDVDFVRIMSIHKSKGLTAKLVIITGCIDGFIPFRNDELVGMELQRHDEEQRRLFYVGLTRSSESLVLSSFSNIERGVGHKLGARVGYGDATTAHTIACPFFREIENNLPDSIRGEDWAV